MIIIIFLCLLYEIDRPEIPSAFSLVLLIITQASTDKIVSPTSDTALSPPSPAPPLLSIKVWHSQNLKIIALWHD